MAKKKKKSTPRHKKQQFQDQDTDVLLTRAESALAAGKPRDAIEFLKVAFKKEGQGGRAAPLLFRAYLLREHQFRAKKMDTEARTVFKQALAYMPTHDRIEEGDLVLFVAAAPMDQAVDAYSDYLAAHPPSQRVERRLADRLVVSGGWRLLETIDPQVPIRRDAAVTAKAAPLMENGDWEAALDLLNPVPRSSPYAPFRLFCRAMAAFYTRNDADLARALKMIPDDFLLSSFAEALLAYSSDPEAVSDRALSGLQGLFAGPIDAAGRVRRLTSLFRNRNRKGTVREIRALAEAVYPRDPDAGLVEILQLLGSMVHTGGPPQLFCLDLVCMLTSRETASSIALRLDISTGDLPLNAAANYIERISHDFPDHRQRKIAKSLVILEALRQSRAKDTLFYERDPFAHGFPDLEFGPDPSKTPWHHLGIASEDPDLAYLEMAREGIACDPDNRQWYELIVELHPTRPAAKKIVEDALETMKAHFPTDPFPCMELAFFYQKKGAYRKAQQAMEDAAERAPYDNQVIEKKAAFYLRSASINLERDKLHLVADDLEKAESLNNRRAEVFVREKRILYAFLTDQAAGETLLRQTLADLTAADRIRLLLVFLLDLSHGHAGQRCPKTVIKPARKRLTAELKDLDGISSSDAVGLLSIVPQDFRPVFPPHGPKFIIEVFTAAQLRKLFSFVDDADMITVCDRLVGAGHHGVLHAELGRRLKKNAASAMMRFYHLILEDMSGDNNNYDQIEALIESVDSDTRAKLEAAASRLAPHARGEMNEMLTFFDFEIPDDPFSFWDDDDAFFDDDDNDDYDDDDDDETFDKTPVGPAKRSVPTQKTAGSTVDSRTTAFFGDMSPEQIMGTLEEIIDRMKLRGAPDYSLDAFRKTIKTIIRPETAGIRELLEEHPFDFTGHLSHEAQIVFLK